MYKNVIKGEFVERPNRFIAKVLIDGREETVHVRNTGRCRELLLKGAVVYLEPAGKERKTKWSLIAVEKDGRLVNIDSQIPNRAVETAIRSGRLRLPGIDEAVTVLEREKKYGSSRFDLYFETASRRGFVEVKGVTLERGGAALFPDAPTERGAKHLNELTHAVGEGYGSFVIFVIQMKGVIQFEPNFATDPLFAQALYLAAARGVTAVAVDCNVGPDFIEIDSELPVRLEIPEYNK